MPDAYSVMLALPDASRTQLAFISVHSWLLLLWRKRGNNLLKARVATQRVPQRIEFEVAVGRAPGNPQDGVTRRSCKLLNSRILIPNINSDSRSEIGQASYIECIDRHLINNC